MSPSGSGCGVSRYESGRPKFESSRFVSQPTLRFCRFLTRQRESSRREGLPTSLVCLKRARDTGVTLKHGDVSACCEHNRANMCPCWPKTGECAPSIGSIESIRHVEQNVTQRVDLNVTANDGRPWSGPFTQDADRPQPNGWKSS